MDTAEGYLLSVYSNAMPVAESFDTEPSLSAETAQALAAQQLLIDTGVPAEETSRAKLLITRIDDETSRTPLLTWLVQASAWREGANLPPVSSYYWIDAEMGEFVRTRDAIKHYDVSGTVVSFVTEGAEALHSSSAVESKPMSRIYIYDQAGTQLLATAAEDGTFTIPALNAPLPVTVRYEGEKASRIENDAGGEYTWSGSLNSPTGNVVKMNAPPTEEVTAQANAYFWITRMYDWILATNPADSIWSHFDSTSQPTADVYDTNEDCNASYNSATNTLQHSPPSPSGCLDNWPDCSLPDPCSNAATASFVAHEFGHLLHELYGLPQGGPSGSYSEGTADIFALYLTDQEIFGKEICLGQTDCGDRRGDNALLYCPGGQDTCYAAHHGGEVLMGAYWKMRERLEHSQGVLGEYVADVLFNAWMNAYSADVEEIEPAIRTQLLVLDDGPFGLGNPGLGNGTPHWADIERGFAEQGFPLHWTATPISLPGIWFSNVTDPGQTTDQVGPYTISADILATFAPPIKKAKLYYRVNGGAFSQPVAMTQSGNTFTGTIPGQTAPAVIEYYLSAEDSTVTTGSLTGQVAEHPVTLKVALATTEDQYSDVTETRYEPHEATPNYERFFVGCMEPLFDDDFDPIAEPGWMSGGQFDDWQIGVPAGASGSSAGLAWSDPVSASSGSNCAGNDILGGAGDNGQYEPDADNWLQTRKFSMSSLDPGDRTFLRFQRWLSVERWKSNTNPSEVAEVRVQSVFADQTTMTSTVWRNHREVTHVDNSTNQGEWIPFEIEITDALEGAVEARIEWGIRSNSNPRIYGGWALDDVEVFSIEALPCQ